LAFESRQDFCIPRAVVYENELMQLIQYKPTIETVQDHPLVIVPPYINNDYILETPKNSVVKYAVDPKSTLKIGIFLMLQRVNVIFCHTNFVSKNRL
jgi:poly(3-hydroxyalkanoate) synthetase